ncbi:MAG: SH3 domain-containing protein [Lachnospiraceae bacterium]|nr:SH3 domain-containing protein [Lachnospiraceae bacterium]
MTTSKTKRIRCFLVLLLGLCCAWILFSASASFAARSTGTVKNRILNVRSQASTSSSVVCKLSQGTKVTILSDTTGTDGMKWYNVYFAYGGDTREGFVRADLINIAGSAGSTTTNPGVSTNSALKSIVPNAAIVRSYPSTKAEIRTRLFKGTIVTLVNEQAADDGRKWSKVSYQEGGSTKEGYIRSDLLTAAPAGATMTTTPSTSTGSPSSGAAKYVNTNVALVRTYASTDGDIRARLVRGTNVTVIKSATGQTDGRTWYKVSYNSNGVSGEGYIRGDLLADGTSSTGPVESPGTTTPGTVPGAPTPVNGTATVIPTVANIRTYASPNGDVRSKLSAGTVVSLISEKTGDDGKKWYKISYSLNGATMEGYIRSDLLTLGGTTTTPTTPTNPTPPSSGGVAQVRSYASPYADVRTTLSNGTKVSIIKEVTGEDGEKWTKISFNQDGKRVEGYVPSSILK